MDFTHYLELALPILKEAKIKYSNREELEKVIRLVKPKVKDFRDLPNWVDYFFNDDFCFSSVAVDK